MLIFFAMVTCRGIELQNPKKSPVEFDNDLALIGIAPKLMKEFPQFLYSRSKLIRDHKNVNDPREFPNDRSRVIGPRPIGGREGSRTPTNQR
jgi:hypothetical protein